MFSAMVGVAQLVERRIVIPVVAGSIPVVHPILSLLPPSFTPLSAPTCTLAQRRWLKKPLDSFT